MIELLAILGYLVVGIIIFFGMVIMENKGIDFCVEGDESNILVVCLFFWPFVLIFIYPLYISTHILEKRK